MRSSRPSSVRAIVVRLTVGSFSLAALLGIVALLTGGDFGATQRKVLLTTVLVGVVSVAVLCYLATADGRYAAVGVIGGAVATVPIVTGLGMIWANAAFDASWVARTFGVGSVVAGTLAQVSLLLALGAAARPAVRRLVFGTMCCAAVVAAMLSVLILTDLGNVGSWFPRVLGVAAILDVLGTVVAAALSKFGTAPPGETAPLSLAPGQEALLRTRAQQAGREPADLLTEAVERFLDDDPASRL